MPFSFFEIYTFVGVVALLVMLPGPNTLLVVQSAGVKGRTAGLFTVLGIMTAVYFNALLSSLGLTLIIAQSARLYGILKLLGAAYIVWLGLMSLIDAYRSHGLKEGPGLQNNAGRARASASSNLSSYSKGLLTGILNPKSALFFFAFFPQFMHHGQSILLQSIILTVCYSMVSLTWYGSLVMFVGTLRRFLMHPVTQSCLKTVTGLLLLGTGLKIAFQRS